MLLITCPHCGDRPELEFRNMGEAHIARPVFSEAISDEDWAEFLYVRSNTKGLIAERWRHVHGCARFFNAVRHTVTDRFVTTYKVGAPRPDLAALAAGLAATEAAR
ncbi:sarcosine oxidase subunit delta [Labrys wisconsinensis]|uniref:Sarcosine oxidase subunit delta n=1 Tax=Labrys wisconsinensis TaxID=425677 RepID=A0ABU0JLE1_9HYPH|nr:sarcosine oxidase subunit delta [Labrys wisconsinensis]MDQ0475104.1 sarcosine oxidase subunit delta [Labrys wisconsinensis]